MLNGFPIMFFDFFPCCMSLTEIPGQEELFLNYKINCWNALC